MLLVSVDLAGTVAKMAAVVTDFTERTLMQDAIPALLPSFDHSALMPLYTFNKKLQVGTELNL